MSEFVYRPRRVVSVKARQAIQKGLGHIQRDKQGTWKSIVKRGDGWAARWRVGQHTYFSQVFQSEADAKKALAGLKARAYQQTYSEL